MNASFLAPLGGGDFSINTNSINRSRCRHNFITCLMLEM